MRTEPPYRAPETPAERRLTREYLARYQVSPDVAAEMARLFVICLDQSDPDTAPPIFVDRLLEAMRRGEGYWAQAALTAVLRVDYALARPLFAEAERRRSNGAGALAALYGFAELTARRLVEHLRRIS